MNLRLSQLIYTHFQEGGLKTVVSDQVPLEIQQAFMQQIVHPYWEVHPPHEVEYQAAYLHQITPQDCLFGWVYNEGKEDESRSLPYFICYHLNQTVDPVLLECIFTCLTHGPATWIERESAPETIESLEFLDLAEYQSVRSGVVIPRDIQAESYAELSKKALLNLFVPSLGEAELSIPQSVPHSFSKLKRRLRSERQPQRQGVVGVTQVVVAVGVIMAGGLSLLLYLRYRMASSPQLANLTPESSANPFLASQLSIPRLLQSLPSRQVQLTPSPRLPAPDHLAIDRSLLTRSQPPTSPQPPQKSKVKVRPRAPQPNNPPFPSSRYTPVFVPANDNALALPFSPSAQVSFTSTPTILLKPLTLNPSDTVPNQPSKVLNSPRQQSSGQTRVKSLSPPSQSSLSASPDEESAAIQSRQIDSASTTNSSKAGQQTQVDPRQTVRPEANLGIQGDATKKITTHDIANAIIRGLVIADRTGEVPYWSRQYLQVQDVIYRLRLGQNRYYAAERSGVPQTLIEKLLTWGGLPPAKTEADGRDKVNFWS